MIDDEYLIKNCSEIDQVIFCLGNPVLHFQFV